LVEEEVDHSKFFTPRKQGFVRVPSTFRYKPKAIEGAPKLQIKPFQSNTYSLAMVEQQPEPEIEKIPVLQIKGELDLSLPENPEIPEEGKLKRSGFATIMSAPIVPHWDLDRFDSLELRVRVFDNRTWIVNLQRDEHNTGEMYQCLFTGRTNDWCSVIIPFRKFLSTFRGRIDGEQRTINKEEIVQIGFLMAERKPGPFCLQLESIRALSMEDLEQEVRYLAGPSLEGDDSDNDGEMRELMRYRKNKKGNFYPVIRF